MQVIDQKAKRLFFQLQLHADFFLSSWSGVQERGQKMGRRHQRIGKSHVKNHSLDSEDIRLPTKICALRDATPLWIMNTIQYLNTPPLNSPDDPNYIGASS